MNMNPMKLNNVVIPDRIKQRDYFVADTEVREPRERLRSIIWFFATANPMWRFECIGGERRMNPDVYTPMKFGVYQDNDELGVIAETRYRNEWVIAISNQRIKDSLDRSSATHTRDNAKAISIIKKTFVAQNVMERMDAAGNKAEAVIKEIEWGTKRKVRASSDALTMSAKDFAFNEKRVEYEAYLGTLTNANALLLTLASFDMDSLDHEVATSLVDAQKQHNTCIVKLHGSKYLVRQGEGVTYAYDDGNFPENLRGKLGLLKLVADKQAIADVGCRVDGSTFVVITK